MAKKHTTYLADIIIPHHDRDDLLERCVRMIPRDRFHVIVQSGGSFAENCNRGAQKAVTDNLIFLNDDTEIDATLFEAMCAKQSDIVGLSQIIPNIPGVIYGLQCVVGDKGVAHSSFAFARAEVFFPSGYCFLIRRAMWEKLEGFFTGFRNGHEDVDLFLRAVECGATCAFVDRPGKHYHSQSAGRSDHNDRNAVLFYERWDKARCEKVLKKHPQVIYRNGRAQWKSDPTSADRSDFYHAVRTHYFTDTTREIACASADDVVAAWDVDVYLPCTGVALRDVYRALGNVLEERACFVVVEHANRMYKCNPAFVPDVIAQEKHFALFVPRADLMMVSFVSHSANRYGAEKSLKDVIRNMVPQGIVPHVIVPSHGFFGEDITDLPVSYTVTPVPWSTKAFLGSVHDYRTTIGLASADVALHIAEAGADMVMTSTSVIDEGALAARILGIPHMWRIAEFGRKEHNIDFLDTTPQRIRFIADTADAIVFSSQALHTYYAEHIGASDHWIVGGEMIASPSMSAASSSQFFTNTNALKIAIVGNLSAGKGQHDAVAAVAEAARRGCAVELVLAGGEEDRDYAARVRAMIAREKIADRVHLVGYVEHAGDLYTQADVVVTCSVFEGFGRTLVEAMLCGKAVIGADSGATSELVNVHKNGLLYPPGDVRVLADHLCYCALHPDTVRTWGENGRTFATHTFAPQEYRARLQEIFAAVRATRTHTVTAPLYALLVAMSRAGNPAEQIRARDAKIAQMHQSGFWKAKEVYEKMRFAVLQPRQFVAKYVPAVAARKK